MHVKFSSTDTSSISIHILKMFRKSTAGKQKKEDSKDTKKKPTFPAYVPSHLDVAAKKQDDAQENASTNYETNQLYVTNLPTNTNMAEISKIFPECVGIALDVNDDKSESHAAYLEFRDSETTERACQRARGSSLRGNTLVIAPKLKYK